jgi:hypothetical protein
MLINTCCGHSLNHGAIMIPDPPAGQIPLKRRLQRFALIVLLGMISCINGIFFIHLYPTGLPHCIAELAGIEINFDFTIIYGYAIYAVLLLGFMATNNRRTINWLTGVLTIATVLNSSGCHHITDGLGDI